MVESLLSVGAAKNITNFGLATQGAGILTGAIGSYYSALSQRYAARSAQLSFEFQGSIADINARTAERNAQAFLEAGQIEKANITLRFGAAKATSRVQQAAAGLQAGVGSAAEVQASIEAAKEIDSLTIEKNALRAANAASTRAVNFRNQALMARVSARNAADSASSVSPGLAAFTSLLGGAGSFAMNMAMLDRM